MLVPLAIKQTFYFGVTDTSIIDKPFPKIKIQKKIIELNRAKAFTKSCVYISLVLLDATCQ